MLWLTLPLLIFALPRHGPAHEKARGDVVGYWTPNSKDDVKPGDGPKVDLKKYLDGYLGERAVSAPRFKTPSSKDARGKTNMENLMHVDGKLNKFSRGGGKAAFGMHGPPAHKGMHHGDGKPSETAIDSLLDDIFSSYGYTTRDEIFLIEELINEAFASTYGTSTDSLVAPGVEPTMEPSSFGMPTSGSGSGWTSGLETSSTNTATDSLLDETVSSYGYGYTTEDEATSEPTNEPTMEPSSFGMPSGIGTGWTSGFETSSTNTATDSVLDETVSSYGTTEDEATSEPTSEPTMEPSSFETAIDSMLDDIFSSYGYTTRDEIFLIEELINEAFASTYGTSTDSLVAPGVEPTMEPSSFGMPTSGSGPGWTSGLETLSTKSDTDSLLDETVSSYGYGYTTTEDELIEELINEAFESTYGTGSPEGSGTGWSGAGDWSKMKRAIQKGSSMGNFLNWLFYVLGLNG